MLIYFFTAIYENLIFNNNYDVIFFCLKDMKSYTKFGLIFILIPIFLWFIFYYLWSFPYGRLWHWILYLFIVTGIVLGITIGIANIEILSKAPIKCPDVQECFSNITGCYEYAQSLPLSFSLWNSLLSLIVSLLCTLGFKQISTFQKHLPF